MRDWKTLPSMGRFLCFGAAGEPCVRNLIDVDRDKMLVLRAETCYSYWDPQDVVPLDQRARLFMAKWIHTRLHNEFIQWRRKYRIRKPSLKAHAAQIVKVMC
jgi:hypothetical protein